MIRPWKCFLVINFLLAYIKAEPLIGHNISPASPLEFPFIASIGLKTPNQWVRRGHFCTGSLISREYVLTAAHCIDDLTPSQVDVIVGDVDLRTATTTYDVDSWITYVDWTLKRGKALEFDINYVAIVKLSRTVNRDNIIPVRLTGLNIQQLHRSKGIVAACGLTNDGTLTDVLLKAKVTILPPATCERNFHLITNRVLTFYQNALCSSALPYTLTACGDSGGPLLNEKKLLVGIHRGFCPTRHWGNFCPEFIAYYRYNIHMSIDYCRDFIEDVAKIYFSPNCNNVSPKT